MGFELTASIHKGMGHIGHNNRTIAVPHADKSRQHLNICHTGIPIQEAYNIVFGKALEEYNRGKKPSRQIKDYYEHIMKLYQAGEEKLQQAISSGASRKEQAKIRSTYQKPFQEIIVSIGNKTAYDGSFACGGENEELAVKVLTEYMAEFQKRNPHLYVFNAVLHRDENGVPHWHISYFGWTDKESKKGLPVRLSEHGAFEQQGLGSDSEYGTIAFQRQEREALTEVAKKHGIEVIEGKHSKRHLSKEEYILSQEKELVNEQAGEVLRQQDDLIEYVSTSDTALAYLEHLENKELHKTVAHYEAVKQRSDIALSAAWDDFNSSTSAYFEQYRKQKEMLYGELQRARENASDSRKRLRAILRDISYSNDFFIVKLFKLAFAIFVALDVSVGEYEVHRLEEENRQIKDMSKKIMAESKAVGGVLRSGEIVEIETTLQNYERQLAQSIERIQSINLNKPNSLDFER